MRNTHYYNVFECTSLDIITRHIDAFHNLKETIRLEVNIGHQWHMHIPVSKYNKHRSFGLPRAKPEYCKEHKLSEKLNMSIVSSEKCMFTSGFACMFVISASTEAANSRYLLVLM